MKNLTFCSALAEGADRMKLILIAWCLAAKSWCEFEFGKYRMSINASQTILADHLYY